MQENKVLEIISEKILQEKIKCLVWNSKIDLIIICYNKSYELQRLGFRHEEIFRKQEKCEILDIKFIEDKEIIAVFLEDKSVNFVDYSNGALLLNHKFSKNLNIPKSKPLELTRKESKMSSNIFSASTENQMFFSNLANCFNCEDFEFDNENYSELNRFGGEIELDNNKNNFSIEEISKKNPYFKDLVYNSFSKIDISYLNFINNKLKLTPSFMFNKKKNNFEIELTLGYLIKIAALGNENLVAKDKFEGESEIFDIKFFEKENFLLLEKNNKSNSGENISVDIKFLNMDLLSDCYRNITFLYYLIFDSIQIINYVNNILGIFNKTFYKLGDIFDDEFLFANNLQYADDKEEFKKYLNKQLKVLFYLGYYQDDDRFKNFMLKYLFDGNSLTKLDEKIHFNLKNIEDILIENIKPCINTLIYNNNQIKIINESFKYKGEIKEGKFNDIFFFKTDNHYSEKDFVNLESIMEITEKINFICENVFNKYEEFLIQINETKINFRNFLSWLYSFNPIFKEREKINDSNINTKTVLNSFQIDYNRLFYFLNDSNYNLNNLISFIEKDFDKQQPENKLDLDKLNISKIDNYERFLYLNLDLKQKDKKIVKDNLQEKTNFKVFKNISFIQKFKGIDKHQGRNDFEQLEKLVKNSKLYENEIAENYVERNSNDASNESKMDFEISIENKENDKKELSFVNKFYLKLEIKEETIKNLLNQLKDYYNSLNNSLTHKISSRLTIQNFLQLKGLSQNSIKKITWLDNNPIFFPYFNPNNKTINSKGFNFVERILVVWYFDNNQNCFCILLFHFVFKVNPKKVYNLNEDLNFNIHQKHLNVERVSYLKFPINMKNIEILDFNVHKTKNLLFLVKTLEEPNNTNSANSDGLLYGQNANVFNEHNKLEKTRSTNNISSKSSNSNIFSNINNNYRYTLINSEISNYSFENVDLFYKIASESNDGKIEIDLNLLNKNEMIKIDSLLDVDCSDNTFISPGKRSFISLIDLKKNKISIIDL